MPFFVYNLDSVNRDDDAIVSESIALSAGNHATAPVRVFFLFVFVFHAGDSRTSKSLFWLVCF